MKIIYIVNARLPTEKAHGYQIGKMCEAFADAGGQVELWHPRRRNPVKMDFFTYYNIKRAFELVTLPNLDVVVLSNFIPSFLSASLFFMHEIVWSFYAAYRASHREASLYYTRNVVLAYWLSKHHLPTAIEVHSIPKKGKKWFLRKLAQQPSILFVGALTSFIREELLSFGFPAHKVAVLPDGVDLSLFDNLPTREECRRKLGLPLENPIIGYVGRFKTMNMEKGVLELVKCLAFLKGENSSREKAPLLVAVGGPMDVVPTYLKVARQMGIPEYRLKFFDRVPNKEVPCWIRACNIVTIPWSRTEFSAYFTSPLKLFEYMASGTPIVATDLPALREVLKDGENAVLVEPGDSLALASGIAQVLSDPGFATRIATQARKDVEQYTWDKRAKHILEAISL